MKKYLKNLLVVAVALMPSLSINTFAQPSGADPEFIPVKETPSPNPHPGPRIMGVDPDVIPIKPKPGDDIPAPRVASVDPEEIPIKSPSGSYPRPRILPDEYDDKPIVPMPDPNPNPNPGPRSSGQEPYCYHIGGVVYIEADATITYINASVTRYDDSQVWSNASNSNTLSITTSGDTGSYLLELTLSDGQYYIGEYVIE